MENLSVIFGEQEDLIRLKKLFKILVTAFRAVVLTATYSLLVFLLLYSIILPHVFHIQPYVVLSSSMEPTIPTGAVVFTDLDDTDIAVGDIVTFRLDDGGLVETGENVVVRAKAGTKVTHRIVEDKGGFYTTKGDNNDVVDMAPLYPYQIIGTYRFHIPKLGYILKTAADSKNRLFVIGIVITLNIAALAFKIAVTDDDEEDKKKDKDSKQKPLKTPQPDPVEVTPEEEKAPEEESGPAPADTEKTPPSGTVKSVCVPEEAGKTE